MEFIKQLPLLNEWADHFGRTTEGSFQKLQGGLGYKVLKNRPDKFLVAYRRQAPT